MTKTRGKPPLKKTEKQDLSIKYYSVSLPSKGKLGYPEEIEYRDIMVRDEKELAGATELTFNKIINQTLKGLLKDQSFFERMTAIDRDFLLLWVWANNYSTHKTVEVQCPHCQMKNTYTIDLTKVTIDDISDEYTNPYEYTTIGGEKVTFRLRTVQDEEIAKKFAATYDLDEFHVLMCQTVEFPVVTALKDKIKKIENEFTGKDMAHLRGFHLHFKYGINDVVSRACEGCGEVNEFSIPFQIDFFLPTLSDYFK